MSSARAAPSYVAWVAAQQGGTEHDFLDAVEQDPQNAPDQTHDPVANGASHAAAKPWSHRSAFLRVVEHSMASRGWTRPSSGTRTAPDCGGTGGSLFAGETGWGLGGPGHSDLGRDAPRVRDQVVRVRSKRACDQCLKDSRQAERQPPGSKHAGYLASLGHVHSMVPSSSGSSGRGGPPPWVNAASFAKRRLPLAGCHRPSMALSGVDPISPSSLW